MFDDMITDMEANEKLKPIFAKLKENSIFHWRYGS